MKSATCLVVFFSMLMMGCSVAPEYTSNSLDQSNRNNDRLIIRTARLAIEVEDTEAASGKISDQVAQSQGYIDESYKYDNEDISLTVRIPADRLNPFVDTISTYGKVVSKTYSSNDVTDDVVDIEAKLKNLYVLRDRFRGLLEKANTVSEILEIERELARVQSEIDSIEGRRAKLKGQVDYSQVHISIEQKTIYGPLGYIGYGIFWVIEKLFVIQ